MAYPILGNPRPAFFDSSGSPLASGTLSILDPADDSSKASYPTYDDAEAATNANGTITLNARGEPANGLWGLDGEDYKVVLKDSDGNTVWTSDDIFLPYDLSDPIRYVAKHNTVASSSGVLTLDLDTYNSFGVTLTENITSVSISGTLTSGNYYEFNLDIIQDSTARTITWPSSFKWANGVSLTVSTASGAIDAMHAYTIDGGTTWRCTYRQAFA